jgi:NAD(P)-dependent dehydrogenase (short-subunit alcohol dehydrogenase family)
VCGAAAKIIALSLPIVALVNNAGIMQMRPAKNAQGWDMTFATNHLGQFALTEALVPHLPDGANVVFVASAVENSGRKPARAAGFRGGRYISAEASVRGEWKPGGAKRPGFDAYATSKQAILAAAMAFARETPRLHFNAVEPGVNPTTALARDAGVVMRFVSNYIIPLLVLLLVPFIKVLSTPEASRARDHQSRDQCILSDRCLLR